MASLTGAAQTCDLDLLEALRLREPMAAERLITRYGQRAYRLASRITGNDQDAEEVVQDALCTVAERSITFRGERPSGPGSYRIVANAAYHKLRGRQKRWRELPLDDVLPLFDANGCHIAPVADWVVARGQSCHAGEVADGADRGDRRTARDLPSVLVLRDVEDGRIRRSRHALGSTVPVVKTRVHRAGCFSGSDWETTMTTLDAANAGRVTRHEDGSRAGPAPAGVRSRPEPGGGQRNHALEIVIRPPVGAGRARRRCRTRRR